MRFYINLHSNEAFGATYHRKFTLSEILKIWSNPGFDLSLVHHLIRVMGPVGTHLCLGLL